MTGKNGVALLRPRVLRVIPQTITYTVEGEDGETVALAGYCKGPSCPVPVAIEIEAAWAAWEEAQPDEDKRVSMKPHAYLAAMNAAERILRRDLLQAAIPGLDADRANVLAADEGAWEAILGELGWWAIAEASDDPEAPAPAGDTAPTGAPSSQDVLPPTQASIS